MLLMNLDLEKFKSQYLIPALESFMRMDIVSDDCSLMKTDPEEVVFSVRIAMHLRDKMIAFEEEGFRVDCEYNKEAGKDKSSYAATSRKNMRPDFIIHKRTLPDRDYKKNNFLICEIKKRRLSTDDNKKIRKSIKERNYKFGLGISEITKTSISLKWFQHDKSEKNEKYKYKNSQLIKQ